MLSQKHTPLQSFPFDIRTVEKRCSYVNTISINLALIKQKRNSDVANIPDTYVKNRHLFANSAPWAGNVSDNEKSGNFPPAPRKPADPARDDFGCSAGRRALAPPCKRIVPTTITQKKNHPPVVLFACAYRTHSVMIRRITRSVSRMPCAASTPTWRMVSSTSSPTMPSPERKLSPLRYML